MPDFGGPQPIDYRSPAPFSYNPAELAFSPNIVNAVAGQMGQAISGRVNDERAENIADNLPSNTDELLNDDNRPALMRLAKLNPQMAKFVIGLAGSNDLQAHQKAADDLQQVSNTFQGFLDIKDPTERNKYLASQIRDLSDQGHDTSKLSELIGMTPDQQTLRARANVIAAGDGKTLVDASYQQKLKDIQLQNQQLENTIKQQEIEKNKQALAAGGTGQGSRAEVLFDRVKSASTLATKAAQNIMELPISSSSGWFGGMTPGSNILTAPASALINKLQPQEVQDYNTMIAGVTRNLAAIETAGLAPNGSLTHSMDAIVFKEGDTQMSKLRKMAEMRQVVEEGMKSYLDNPKIPQAQKDGVIQVVNDMKTAVPFTHHDLTVLERQKAKNPNLTISDVIQQKGLGGPGNEPQGQPQKIGRFTVEVH